MYLSLVALERVHLKLRGTCQLLVRTIKDCFAPGFANHFVMCEFMQDQLPQLVRSSLGVSSLRLQPKSHGVRPIINAGSRSTRLPNGGVVEFFPIGIKLRQIHSVVQYEVRRSYFLLSSPCTFDNMIMPVCNHNMNISCFHILTLRTCFSLKCAWKFCHTLCVRNILLPLQQSSSPHPLSCSSVDSFVEIYNKWKHFALSERAKPTLEREL